MAKIILRCTRDGKQDASFSKKISTLSKRLIPDNISPPPPLIIQDCGISIAVFNPCPCLPINDTSVCMGNLLQPRGDWWKPLTEIPDGSYALFRSDENTVELLSDILGTRTVWYFQTEKEFIASTSQRAIISFLQEFQPNPDVYPWMLSSGTLGPYFSWDTRIKFLKADTRLVLDRSSWKVAIHQEPVRFTSGDIPYDQQEALLKQDIEEVFENLVLDHTKWLLPLSGGLDSRAILLLLKNRKNFKCITWGVSSSLKDKKNDAYIANMLAQHFNLSHEFFETDASHELFDTVFERFLIAGEGRIDNIAGYMDGFKIWKHLFDSGYQGILRGDQAFGNRAVIDAIGVYKSTGFNILSDFENLSPITHVLQQYKQSRPPYMEKRENESLEGWRDRVNAEFEIPIEFAALNDLKLSYVEIVNPFLSRRIVNRVRQLPDDLRTDKSLFRKIVHALNPDIPFAQVRAVSPTKDCLNTKEVLHFIIEELSTDHAKSLLPEPLIQFILQNLKAMNPNVGGKTISLYRHIRQNISKGVKKTLKQKTKKQILSINIMALRACLICRMKKLLSADAKSLSQTH